VIDYFSRAGARQIQEGENPAEWMLAVTQTSTRSNEDCQSWSDVWLTSADKALLMETIHSESVDDTSAAVTVQGDGDREFAIPFSEQYTLLLHRTCQEFWRSPSYLWSKFGLCCGIVS